jgi:hypothetical protein
MKIINHIIRILTGLVFVFSAIVKGIDPLGSTYKFADYFQAFHLDFLIGFSLTLAIILCTCEFFVGLSLVSGLRLKTGIRGAAFFMIIFTPVTLILAIHNPVSDCGCFGDAIHLTNWQTFIKNVIISGFVIVLLRSIRGFSTAENGRKEWIGLGIVVAIFLAFIQYNYKHLPVIDFLPYKPGTNISAAMTIPEGAPTDEYSISFIYEKEGDQKEFTLSDYPANDTTWRFVSQKSKILKQGYKPPIHDFSITSKEGNDITDIILEDPDYSLIMITKKIGDALPSDLEKGFSLGTAVMSENLNFYVLTASSRSEVEKFYNGLNFCFADETTLKSIVRANPGYILIKDGVILAKWAGSDLPDENWFSENMEGKQLSAFYADSVLISAISITLAFIGILFLLCILLKRNVLQLNSINK